ncbi:NLP/P60 protein [Intrasporangium oryzae NRRL B-24470]|uniref:NLP/P60 protein n=1 Tax=Intrasporangium oryzae NRRL B-24470 TaxID=1386089 RepID=W9G3V2_9MICO|nr:C40 family peptidase [Intrasporangium oryzae]EWT00685.1 NLP/P60 protein [Intrasporangium oryzae NRRL B-24470]
MAQNVIGRHRVPGRFNPLSELKIIAKESAQPAVKGAAIVAASGGLVATFASPANAADSAGANVAADVTAGAAVVGPQTTTLKAANALSSIGFAQASMPKQSAAPQVIEDIVVKTERAEAKAKAEAEAKARAARQAAASRSTTRSAINAAPTQSATGIVGIAQSMFGVPYVYGGSSPSGFDCSGFTSWVYRQAGITIPRTASAQQAAATRVSSPRPGDLVFFGYPAYHVGIYVSPGRMIDAQRTGTVIGNHSIWTTPSGYGRF